MRHKFKPQKATEVSQKKKDQPVTIAPFSLGSPVDGGDLEDGNVTVEL
jgi:hypothetical protein